ncbi:MAG: spore coat U domain-containing protein [Rhodanobacteraceae bacterium]
MNSRTIVHRTHARICRVLTTTMLALIAPLAHAACGISTQGVEFGAYDSFSADHADSVGAIIVTCDEGDAYSVAISMGGGTYAGRKMIGARQTLLYNLYTDPAHTLVWGDGNGATATAGGIGTGTANTLSVYGRMPAHQNVSVGRYVDSIVVTISF